MSYPIDFDKLASAKTQKSNYSQGYQQKNNQQDNKFSRKLNFLKIHPGESAVIRPVGKIQGFWRFWYPDAHRDIIAKIVMDESGKIIESNLDELKELLKVKPDNRFAMNAIDRSDQQIKIWAGPISVMDEFSAIAKIKGIKPGGKNGGDWKITAEKNDKYTNYKCEFLKPTPFTEDELMRIQNPDKAKNEWYILDRIYKPTDMEFVYKLLGKGSPATESADNSSQSVMSSDSDDLPF